MDFLLRKIYVNYYNIENTLNFSTDKEFIKFVYALRNINDSNFNAKKYIKEYNENIKNKMLNDLTSRMTDSFFN